MGKYMLGALVVFQTFAALGLLFMWGEVSGHYINGQPVGKFMLTAAVVWVASVLVFVVGRFVLPLVGQNGK